MRVFFLFSVIPRVRKDLPKVVSCPLTSVSDSRLPFPFSPYEVFVNCTLLSLIYSTFSLSRLRFPYLRLNNGEHWVASFPLPFSFSYLRYLTFRGRTPAREGGPHEIFLFLRAPCPCEAKPGVLLVFSDPLSPHLYSSMFFFTPFIFLISCFDHFSGLPCFTVFQKSLFVKNSIYFNNFISEESKNYDLIYFVS